MKTISTIKDILIIVLVAWLGYLKATEETLTKIAVKEVIKYIDKPTQTTISKTIFRAGSDTVIYLTSYDTINNTTVVYDSVIVQKDMRLFHDSISLDSSGYVLGVHMYRDDTLTSKYKPFLLERTKFITNTVFKPPGIQLYGTLGTNGSIGFSLNGFKLQEQAWQFGYSYDPFANVHQANLGIRLFHF